MLELFMNKSKKLLAFQEIRKKLCFVIPDFTSMQSKQLDSADTLLQRIKTKPPNSPEP